MLAMSSWPRLSASIPTSFSVFSKLKKSQLFRLFASSCCWCISIVPKNKNNTELKFVSSSILSYPPERPHRKQNYLYFHCFFFGAENTSRHPTMLLAIRKILRGQDLSYAKKSQKRKKVLWKNKYLRWCCGRGCKNMGSEPYFVVSEAELSTLFVDIPWEV